MEERLLVFSTTGVCATKKKQKLFKGLMLLALPIPPKFKVERCSSTRLYKNCLFFLQVVALMSAAASTLNFGGKGGEQQNEQNGFASIFANTGIR